MRTGAVSEALGQDKRWQAVEKEKQCGDCRNNEDGFCDFLGILIRDDDRPKDICKGKGYENG